MFLTQETVVDGEHLQKNLLPDPALTPPRIASVVVVLVEHWATSRSVNLHRTAHYVLDLMERDPGCPVVPVSLVTDLKPGAIPECIKLDDLGGGSPILTFRHRAQVVAHEDLMGWHRRSNVVAGGGADHGAAGKHVHGESGATGLLGPGKVGQC